MTMTGRYRFRTGWGGVQVLQVEHNTPLWSGGRADASVRRLEWSDATPSQAQDVLDIVNAQRGREKQRQEGAQI